MIMYILNVSILDELSKINQELKEINANIVKLTKRKTELLELKNNLKQLSYQKQTNSISDQTNWTHTGKYLIIIIIGALHWHLWHYIVCIFEVCWYYRYYLFIIYL